MVLRSGDFGNAVRTFQRGLNKLGSILLIDGDFGPATREAVSDARVTLQRPGPPAEADDQLQAAVAAVKDPFPFLTAPGATFIARTEVGGPQQYRRLYCRPAWPGKKSGITIGIGYDLRFAKPRAKFNADWADCLPPKAIDRLAIALGAVGSKDRCASLQDIQVPLGAAMMVFLKRTLPEYVEQTRSIYAQIDTLTPAQRTVLVSLVYNRGTDLKGDSRREMRAIRDCLAAGDLAPISEQVDSMARLWDPAKAAGLVKRRHDEARLWRSGFAALQLD